MATLRKAVGGAAMLAAAAASIGCGAAKEQDKGGDRARYAVQADLVCESLRTQLVALPRPLTHARLGRYLGRADEAMRTAAVSLHDARRTLGAGASAQVRAFDRQLDSVLDVTGQLSDDAAKRKVNPGRERRRVLIGRAEEARRAFAVLRRSAQAAGLRRCGLGGDDLADAVLFTTYRVQYLRIQDATFSSLRRAPFRRSDSLARYLRTSRRYLTIRSAEYRRVRRLTPPAALRPAHDLLVDRFGQAIRADRQLQSAFFRRRRRAISSATTLLQRRDSRYLATERKLRRMLNGSTAA